MTMKLRWVLAALLALAVLGTGALAAAAAVDAPGHAHKKVAQSEVAFHDGMRKLWEDHVTWTRMVIVEVAAGSAATDATVARLLQNQVDIGDAIKPFYGDDAGDQLTELLTDHIVIAADILVAAKAGDQDAVAEASDRWDTNADDIAAFLGAANPEHWPVDEMQAMMHEHLDLTLSEAVARLQGDYAADIAAYDELHVQILQMADMLSDGIISQFPASFR